MTLSLAIILLVYLFAMIWVIVGMKRLTPFPYRKTLHDESFSIIVPFRNESQHIARLIDSFRNLEYPIHKFEILFVDDASTDDSVAKIHVQMTDTGIAYQVLTNQRKSKSPKKDAIRLAVAKAGSKWIATTDADCEVPKHWLRLMSDHIHTRKSKMICGPVLFNTDDSLLQQFQFWDGLSLQAATMAGFGWNKPMLCNGANLAFERAIFYEVNAFDGNDHLATGDDIFLMEKFKRSYPGQIHYIKNPEAAVKTFPMEGLDAVLGQRIRWASKTAKSKNLGTTLLGITVFLGNIAFIIALASCFLFPMEASVYVSFLCIKLLMDISILGITAHFFNRSMLNPALLPSNFSYPFVVLWVFLNSWRGRYEWKGRSFQK